MISGQGASSASDIWAIGATLIELLTGKPPYANTREPMAVLFRIMEDRHPPFPRVGSQTSSEMSRVVGRYLYELVNGVLFYILILIQSM